MNARMRAPLCSLPLKVIARVAIIHTLRKELYLPLRKGGFSIRFIDRYPFRSEWAAEEPNSKKNENRCARRTLGGNMNVTPKIHS